VLSPEASRFDPDFSRAAAALDQRGQVSPPVASAFGVHVIMLLEKTPERVLPKEERLALLTPEIMSHRARQLEQALLVPARESAEVDLSADALLALVPIEP
jgi:peptidyl-prolyl cis-trans isomerase C